MPGLPRTLLNVAAVAAIACAPMSAHAQSTYARFDVTSVTDTTVTFATAGARWVSPGQSGLAVDAAHGDRLIARFRVTAVSDGRATATVTGQTARLSAAQVALLRQPKPGFYQQPWFWVGLLAGGVVGFVAHGH